MSWMQQLAEVYDHNKSQVGVFEERRNQRMTLLPVSHVMQNSQIEILVTQDGEFKSAKVVEKENARIIVPATTASANRANASAPHYIHDKLQYVAGDFIKYGGSEKRKQHHLDYYNQMKEWSEVDNASAKVKSIYAYISKGTVMRDLIQSNILPTNSEGKVIEKWPAGKGTKPDIYKVVPTDVYASFVRFDVEHREPGESVVWEDENLFNSFIYFLEMKGEMKSGICYVTNENTDLTTQHGSRLRNAGDMSKLISGNDGSGFTYRGRFSKATEAVQIGYEVSQKSHHALRWLIQRQGTYMDSRYFVTFGIEEAEVLEPYSSTFDVVNEFLKAEGDSERLHTEEAIALEVDKALKGMHHELKEENLDNVIVMALDAATTGRLAIVYYQHLNVDSFFESIENWHNTCKWVQSYKNPETNKIKTFSGAPSTYRIAEAVYGKKVDSRVKKDLYTRLLPCIVEQKSLPKDIVRIIFDRVKNPYSFTNSNESWTETINVACALTNKLYEEEGYTVALQKDNNSRDYLFGRMLGIAEVMERRMLKERDENRATNATRYFNAYTQHPARTWMVIRKQLAPYFERSGSSAGYYAMLLQQIEDKITFEQMTSDPLGPVFLLGYSSQIQDLYTKKEDNKDDSIKS